MSKPDLDKGTTRPATIREATIVVPCHNESLGLENLAARLEVLFDRCKDCYRFDAVIVDDGSTDDTWAIMQSLFGDHPAFRLLRLEAIRGIWAATAQGAALPGPDIVCTMDSDCSYDPILFAEMIPLLEGNVAMVTASPHHPEGEVRDVPWLRLLLSRGLSKLYRLVLRQKLSTYTSCFRVYQRSAIRAVEVREPGFVGIAEIAARLDQAGHRIVEFPAPLARRRYGVSKLRTVATIFGHLRLLMSLSLDRRPAMLGAFRWLDRVRAKDHGASSHAE